jgi:hypothetical protein
MEFVSRTRSVVFSLPILEDTFMFSNCQEMALPTKHNVFQMATLWLHVDFNNL